MQRFMFAPAAAFALLAIPNAEVRASVLTGSYDPRTSVGSLTTGTGPYTLISYDGAFSLLRFTPTTNPLFSELTDLYVKFFSPEQNAAVPPQASTNVGGGQGARDWPSS